MLDGKKYASAHFAACDHATPVLYGVEQPGLMLTKGRSPESNPRNPRLHRLLMDRLARLVGDAELRPQFLQVLDTLEQTKDFAQLPVLFATTPGDAKELDYLSDALATSLDQFIRDASPDARRVLWMIAVANEPITLGLLEGVWSGESYEQQQLRQIKQMIDHLPLLPSEFQEKLKGCRRSSAPPPRAPAAAALSGQRVAGHGETHGAGRRPSQPHLPRIP